MRRVTFPWVLLLLTGCSAASIAGEGDVSDARARTAALPEGAGVLRADFDPERIAPASAPGATGHEHHHGASAQPTAYTCSHHPDVVSSTPGKCPKCGMDLVPKKPAAPSAEPSAAPNPHEGH